MDELIRQILDDLPEREGRSRLEPYRELIFEMRHRRYSYRQISRLLGERCELRIGRSAIQEFVTRHSRPGSGSSGTTGPSAGTIRRSLPAGIGDQENGGPSVPLEEIRLRIAAVKRRPSATADEEPRFHFDPSRPLRLDIDKL